MRAVIQVALVSSICASQEGVERRLPRTSRVEPSQRQRFGPNSAGWASIRMLAAPAFAVAIVGCNQADGQVRAQKSAAPSQLAVVEEPEAAAEPARGPRRFTKQEFAQYIQGMTKADIRREFGPPLVVHDDTDSWFYSDLPVYDADAGIQVSLTIRFMGLTPAEADEVLEVSY